MTAQFGVRPMTPADVDGVTALAASLKRAPHWPRASYLAIFNPAARPQRLAVVAASPEQQLLGFAVAAALPPEAELESIAVAADFQRRGLARTLFEDLLGRLRDRGIADIVLEVRPSNAPAQAFYRSLGFVECGRRPRYYFDPIEDALVWHYKITAP